MPDSNRAFMLNRRQLFGAAAASAALVGVDLSVGRSTPAFASAAPNVVIRWSEAVLQAIRTTHPGPPQVARMLAVTHTAMYDAWAAYDDTAVGTRLGGALRQPAALRTTANKAAAISYAAYRALVDLFPSEVVAFTAVMTELGYPVDTTATGVTAAGVGNIAAEAVIEFRHLDGSNQLGGYEDTTGYRPVNDPDHINDPNRWQPLRVSDGKGGWTTQKFIAPHWGLVTPFAISGPDQFTAPPPAKYGTRAYIDQTDQITAYSAKLTDRQKVIAEYWADGPDSELPPGHWCKFAHFVSRRDSHTLDEDVTMFFSLTNAILDASIACWGAKRAYDYVRPVTAVRYLYRGKKIRAWAGPNQGTQLIDGRDWQPYQAPTVVTPPFAEYTSGHSTFSAASAEVLKRFTGSDAFGASHTQPAGTSKFEDGVPGTDVTLSWATFSAAADEAGISRRYGGIHFIDGDLNARVIGRQIAAVTWDRAVAYIQGRG